MHKIVLTWLKIFLLLILFFLAVPKTIFAAAPNKTIRVGVYENKPKIYTETNGKVSGFFADVLDFIAIQENWKMDYVHGSFAEGLSRLEKGDIDIMVDVAYTEDRAKIYDFTKETVLGSWGVVYVQKATKADTFSDLNGMKIAILKNSVYLEGTQGINAYIKAFGINVTFVEAAEYTDVFQLLQDGKVDAAVVSRIFGLTNAKDYPAIKDTNIYFEPTELRLALHKGNPDNPYLIERLDYWLIKIKEGYRDFFKDSLQKYGLAGMSPQKEVIPQWVMIAGGIILGVLFLSLFIILLLRRAKTIVTRDLQQKELMLGNVVNNTPIFLSSVNNKGIITMFAGKGTGIVEFLPEKVVGKSAAEVFKATPAVAENVKRALGGETVVFRAEIAKRIWKIQVTPLKEDGQVVSLAATAFDISEEDKINKEKTEFIYLASHHLRTPSNEIKWYLQLLWPRINKVVKGQDLDMWTGITKANDHIIDLADTLSVCSWIEMSSFSPSLDKIDLPKLIEEVLLNNKNKIDEKKITVNKNFNGIVELFQDSKKIKTIMGTLLSNAVIYSEERGIIGIEATSKNNKLLLSVSDRGLGIPKNEQSMIFKRLFRGSNAIKQYPSGIGLSLYISKTIIEKLGGKIWFISEENKGSTFYVEIPLQEMTQYDEGSAESLVSSIERPNQI
jgi:signal transduction histidine kinase/ABC-type amino acid transport substrate-binding protein